MHLAVLDYDAVGRKQSVSVTLFARKPHLVVPDNHLRVVDSYISDFVGHIPIRANNFHSAGIGILTGQIKRFI